MNLPQEVRKRAGAVMAALSALADSAGEAALGGSSSASKKGRSAPSDLPAPITASVLRVLSAEAASIALDPVTVINSIRSALRAADCSAASRSKKKSPSKETATGPLSAEEAAAMGAFLLARLAGGCARPAAANAEATAARVALLCLRDWGEDAALLDAAAGCLRNIIVRTAYPILPSLKTEWNRHASDHGMTA